MNRICVTSWVVEDKDEWLPCDESFLTPSLEEQFNMYIFNRRYLNVDLNLILISQNTNCGLFLNTATGEWIGVGMFYEKDVTLIPTDKKPYQR